MKKLSIRMWLTLALLLIVMVPVITVILVGFPVLQSEAAQPRYNTIFQEVAANAARWTDPAWQRAETARLASLGKEVVIVANNGQEIYRSGADLLAFPSGPVQGAAGGSNFQIVASSDNRVQVAQVMQGKKRLGLIYVYEQLPARTQDWPLPVAGLVALLLVVLAVGWFIGRTFLRPLAALTQAARQIADNDLDVTLPSSRVREIAQVSAAFGAMSVALRDALYRQAELEQERRLFISAIAHDLRTPLFSLRGYLEGLEKGIARTPERVAKYIAVCQEKANALERLIADLFAYAQLEYLEQTPNCEALDLGDLLHKVVSGLHPLAETEGVALLADGPQPCMTEGDAHLLTRAVENLLENALRYTPAGGTIRLSWHENAGHLTFAVADSGPGIDPRDLPHLFSPLYRGDTSRSRQTGGAGLGLTIARRILLSHGGDLNAGNQPAGGAIFTGSLPSRAQAQPSIAKSAQLAEAVPGD